MRSPAGLRCATCVFFARYNPVDVMGECRAKPPVPRHGVSESQRARWPRVADDEWCGTHNTYQPEPR